MKRFICCLTLASVSYLLIFTIIVLLRATSDHEETDARFAEFFYYHNVLRVSGRPLFSADGSINQDVLENLITILNTTPHNPTTAAGFSNFVVPDPNCISHSGAIIIKLFETVPD